MYVRMYVCTIIRIYIYLYICSSFFMTLVLIFLLVIFVHMYIQTELISVMINNIRIGRPYITRNPSDIITEITTNVHFSVQAGGYGYFTYQWYHNGNSMPNEISATLYISHVNMSNEGYYYCYICNQDGYCATSSNADLTVAGMLIYILALYNCIFDTNQITTDDLE